MIDAAQSDMRRIAFRWFPSAIRIESVFKGIFPASAVVSMAISGLVSSSPASAGDLARGQYLVEALTACDNCHTPRGPDGYVMASRFSGGSQLFSGKTYSVRGSNISTDRETGIGAWTDDELRAAIVDGVGPKGRLAPVMPSESYRILTKEDLNAIIAYLRSMPAVRSPISSSREHGAEPARAPLVEAESPLRAEDLGDELKRGLYVASLARCMGCHSGEAENGPDHEKRLGAGGKVFRTPNGVSVASNITSHPSKGIGSWTDDEIKQALTRGISRDGRPLAPTMANLSRAHFSKMTDEDLRALIAWLRTIPPHD